MSTSSNILKRKNEDSESPTNDQLNKRVALDSEQLALNEKQQEEFNTAPAIPTAEENQEAENEEDSNDGDNKSTPESSNEETLHQGENGIVDQSIPSKPVSNHREKESDPTYVSFRMFCPVKEASCIVGKKGEKINHLREKAGVRMNVSENLKNVPERIVSVRGPAENVARAFGLIARTILEEPEDEPASMLSRQYNMKILVPHPMVGFIIGKSGSKFREIEENSAAKLKAAEQPLPYSTDRILSVSGVGDAIHIAVYYISQVFIEHKDCLKKNKVVYYNPANHNQSSMTNYNNVMNMPMMQQNTGMVQSNTGLMMMQRNPATNPLAMQGIKDTGNPNPYGHQAKQPYNFQMMFQPSANPQQHYSPASPAPAAAVSITPQAQYTDEHGNTLIGDVITNSPVQVGPNPDKFNEDIFVANSSIGSVIGKGGNNIKHIRENSGCSYVKIEPDRNQSIMLGGGRGLTSIRKLTLTGSLTAIQTAIYLINQRIGADKERNHIH